MKKLTDSEQRERILIVAMSLRQSATLFKVEGFPGIAETHQMMADLLMELL
jgi:hypothetical protein